MIYEFTVTENTPNPVGSGTWTGQPAPTGTAVTFDSALETRTFSYYYTGNLDLAGALPIYETEYNLTVHAYIDDNGSPYTKSADHLLTIKNPCVDSEYINLSD